uniref:Uncharacterized protein n=1 Tax=viral metagenome TaxID=1070528 RepID=A0A6M3IIF6_9ZZZZ
MKDLIELSYDAADKVEILAGELHKRVGEETKKLLKSQIDKLGIDESQLKKTLYPDDPETLCTYEYDGKPILGVKIGPNGMSILFDVPELKETQKGEEVHV